MSNLIKLTSSKANRLHAGGVTEQDRHFMIMNAYGINMHNPRGPKGMQGDRSEDSGKETMTLTATEDFMLRLLK